jgi:hypothetical protein
MLILIFFPFFLTFLSDISHFEFLLWYLFFLLRYLLIIINNKAIFFLILFISYWTLTELLTKFGTL